MTDPDQPNAGRSKTGKIITSAILVAALIFLLATGGTPTNAVGWIIPAALVIALILNAWSLVTMLEGRSK